MDRIHKKALTQSRSKIVSDLSPDNEFWDKIAEQEIFTPLMLEYIQAKSPRPDKVRQLLDDLLRRGPHAYTKFLYCLDNSGHNHLAQVIRNREHAIRHPDSTPPIIQEARFISHSESESSIFHHPTESSNHRDTPLHQSASSEPLVQHNPLHQIYASNSSPNIAASGSIVTSPSDESLGNNMAVQNNETNDVRMENDADAVSVPQVSVPDTSIQDTDRQEQSITTERTKAYPMSSTPRGFVLIINNHLFSNGKHRPGSHRDGEMMTELFTGFGFQVDVKKDQTAQEIEELLYQLSRLENLHNVDSLIVVLMSHGNSEYILGTDGDKRNIINLVKLFDRDHCPAMTGKPKMFIVNACRGDDVGCSIKLGSTRSWDRTETDGGSALSSLNSQLPANSDLLLAYSTFPGNVSFRDENEGSWFIQKLVEVFKELAAEEHVMDMMTEVNNRVADMSESELGYTQTPAPMTTLRYKWYLNPSQS